MCRNKNIQGIRIDKEEFKLELFADDVTAFLRNSRSVEALFIMLICSASVEIN